MEFSDITSVSLLDMLLVRAIADKGSVSKAATLLQIAQPTATYRLNKLREIFRDPIFVNVNRKMRPTDNGIRMIATFRDQIDNFALLIEPEQFDPTKTDREFKIISHGVLIPGLLTAVPKQFFNRTLNARLFFETAESDLSVNQQLHERADFYAWTFDPIGAIGIRRLVSPKLRIVMHYDANFRDPPKTIEEYVKCKPVKLDLINRKLGLVDIELIKRGFEPPREFCFATTIESVSQLVRGTNLVYCGTKYFADGDPSGLDIADMPFEVPGIRHELRWSMSKESNKGHAWMLELITEASKKIATQSPQVIPNEGFVTLTEHETLP